MSYPHRCTYYLQEMNLPLLLLQIFLVLYYHTTDGFVLSADKSEQVAVHDRSPALRLVSPARRHIFGTIAAGVITTVVLPPIDSVANDDKPKDFVDELTMPAASDGNLSQVVSGRTSIFSHLFFLPRRLAKK